MGDWRVIHDDRRDPCPYRKRIKITGGSMSTTATGPEIDGLKARLRETWMAGDYDRFSRYMEQGARIFYEQIDVPAPVLWGDEKVVRERLGHGVSDLTMTRRQYSFNYPFPPTDVVEFFRQYYGPTNRAFASLDEMDSRKLRVDLEALWSAHNRGGDEFTVVSSEYLEVIAVRA